MKIQPAHFAHMQNTIERYCADNATSLRLAAHAAALQSDTRVKDHAKRLRWDIMYAAGLSLFACDELYSYADDTHIDTALKKIMKGIQIQ